MMKVLLSGWLLVAGSLLCVCAQPLTGTDSISLALNRETNPLRRLDLYPDAIDVWESLHLDSALVYANRYLSESQQYEPSGRHPGRATMYLGSIRSKKGEYPEALSQYQQALAYAQQRNDTLLAAACEGNIAILYAYLGKHREAMEMYRSVTRRFEAMNSPDACVGYLQMAALYLSEFNAPDSTLFLCIRIQQRETLENERYADLLGASYELSGSAFEAKGESSRAVGNYLKAIQLYRRHNQLVSEINVRRILAGMYLDRKEPEKCIEQTRIADSLVAQTGYTQEHFRDAMLRGLAFAALKEISASDAAFQEALQHARNSRLKTEEAEILESRTQACKQTGRFREAKRYRKAGEALRKEIEAAMPPPVQGESN